MPAMGPSKTNHVLTTGLVAKVCRVSSRTVSKWFDKGLLKGYRIPGSNDRRIRRRDLEEFMIKNNMSTDLLNMDAIRSGVLVVTDSTRAADSVLALNSVGSIFEVAVVKNAFEAGQYRRVPRVVVIDFAIGRVESIQLVRALRNAYRDQLPRVKFYAIVGEDEVDLSSLRTDELFDHVVQQPCNIAALIEGMFVEQGV